ncbi:MAG: VIT family protein [Methylotenera sp.]|nr:VIT family protein [Methylotenera sp.]
MRHSEYHRAHRIGWLRASVLGANDGLISTASLIIGVTAAHSTHEAILMTGIAGLVGGAMSMAAGEYVSVSSQADTEAADLLRESIELETDHENELKELANIYVGRGLTPDLASQVAVQLTAHDALGSHATDELGIIEQMNARPTQAALASAATFALGASLPLLITYTVNTTSNLLLYISISTLIFLAVLGGLAAKIGGANLWVGTARVACWGLFAMAITAATGSLLGVVVN